MNNPQTEQNLRNVIENIESRNHASANEKRNTTVLKFTRFPLDKIKFTDNKQKEVLKLCTRLLKTIHLKPQTGNETYEFAGILLKKSKN